MKKRILFLILAALMIVGSIGVLTACGGGDACTHVDVAPADGKCDKCGVTMQSNVCRHSYDNACDVDCNDCGKTRTPAAHVYDNECDKSCNVCGAVRTVEDHVYDSDCDKDCNECGKTRTPKAHVYDNACDASCNVCSAERTPAKHKYSNGCDIDCNVCGEERDASELDHNYDEDCSEECNVCGAKRSVPDSKHSYAYKCSTECDLCGKTRKAKDSDHTYKFDCSIKCMYCTYEREVDEDEHEFDNACDDKCNVCGAKREVEDHVYDSDCDKYCNECEKSRTTRVAHTYDHDCDVDCNACYEVRSPKAHVYDHDCDADCNNCGNERVTKHADVNRDNYCDKCGEMLDPDNVCLFEGHKYDNDCDDVCNVCEYKRAVGGHIDIAPKDGLCDNCAAVTNKCLAEGHTYANACDKDCDVCGAKRSVPDHVDADSDKKCDICEAEIDPCKKGHTYSSDCDAECDVCGYERTASAHSYTNDCDADCDECGEVRVVEHTYTDACDESCNVCGEKRVATHVDANADGKCDSCGKVTCAHTYDSDCDADCNLCGATRTAADHVDSDEDGYCNVCDEEIGSAGGGEDPCADGCAKINEDADGYCDNCGAIIRHRCKDDNGDSKCDVCSKPVASAGDDDDYPPVSWKDDDPINLFFMMSHNSDAKQNPSGCQRYLAGEDYNVSENIDTMVRARNSEALYKTNVSVKYDYYDDVPEYGWGDCIEIIYKNVESGSTTAPDMYCNFTYDMVGASLKGSFANLKNTSLDKGNYFQFLNEGYDENVDNLGYMFEYMESTTLSLHKMYILASDYFMDLVRAFFIVPVNIELLEAYGMEVTGDRTGDGKFTIDDFYKEVQNKEWTYQKVMDYSAKVYKNTGTSNAAEDIEDVLGFALAQGGLAPSGILYSTNITIINKKWNETKGDYDYSYPTEANELYTFFENVGKLVDATGVTYVSSADPNMTKYGSDARIAVRNRFCDNKVLFGGVIVLGALEYTEYQKLKNASGFGVVPVPLYHEVSMESDENYLTAIHNNARPGGIARNTRYFSACTAFLDYQSTHSTDILTEYYDFNLQYNVVDGAVEGTVEMLQYIRKNVRSAFDKTFEDAIGVYNDKEEIRWHHILSVNGYKYDIRKDYGSLRTEKQGYLETLYAEYPKLP